MSRSPGVAPRRIPRQERSRRTVERILDAAAALLAERGYDGASANRIARAAGVGHGSLYQYFPNRDAIVVAVLDRFADRFADRLGARVDAVMTEPWEVAARTLIDAQIELLSQDAGLLRVIERAPRLGPVDTITALRRRITDLVRAYLLLNRPAFRDDLDVDASLWILAETVGTLTVRYVLDDPPIPRARMVDELTTLVVHHLQG